MIDKEQVQHIAKLARISLTEEELSRYQQDLSAILNYFDILRKANTEETEPMTHSTYHKNVAREDVPKRERPEIITAMLELAPCVKDGFFKVKAILSSKSC
ncbi:MAG: hypothetical protein A2672_01435 [Candidatus Wildermuthbacteria bacterium RIFCSPHIGHO2_01_FULL_49_22b]|uniref:Aspartyl/glutamyl-tRNA(Asn/Gln) amidotransferase subunit C n=1 Tax=Candidatus Wildermuthbacteria bacterium RIFCSPHIGHO2_01_FULL_49_22b TaxID=1802448 RepID=A0A1G2QXW1_9BACT|nr:MAG: hypothetical protein A2672_01435 [Candidatus Wildermuthbacteria bacterium RIFCSPHIGHO2_01_FULL_49_22b]